MKAFAIRFLVGVLLLMRLAPAWPAETIRIAFIGGLSGPYALQDEEALKSVRMSADIVNTRGGVLAAKNRNRRIHNKAKPAGVADRTKNRQLIGTSTTSFQVGQILLSPSTDAVAKHNARNPDRSVLFSITVA